MGIRLLVLLLFGVNLFVWHAVFASDAGELRVSFLNIGQGDSILVQGPTGIQMLVDGGPDRSVLRELPGVMRLTDRTIDVLVETHPDKDHISGLAGVFGRYAVSYFLTPGIPNDTNAFRAVETAADAESNLVRLTVRRGMRIHLGGGAYADVLYPDRDPSRMDTNDGSVVLHVIYGDTAFMLTGDLPSSEEDWLVALDADDGELPTDVLKAGHHGSKFSTDDSWLAALHPSFVVISAGKGNSYGHPAPETLARIKNEGATIVSTIDEGTITFVSDGKTVRRK